MQVSHARWLVAVSAFALAVGSAGQTRAGSGTGEAYGVFAQSGGTVVVPKTPDVVLPPGGSSTAITKSLVSFQQPGVASASVLDVSTQGVINGNNGTITSSAEADGLNVLNGVVTAEVAAADSSSGQHTDQGNQNSARISSGGASFTGLTVAGVPIQDSPPPNTTITIPGVGVVILNEQILNTDNLTFSSLTVNAIHVILMSGSLVTGEIIVSSAQSGVNFLK